MAVLGCEEVEQSVVMPLSIIVVDEGLKKQRQSFCEQRFVDCNDYKNQESNQKSEKLTTKPPKTHPPSQERSNSSVNQKEISSLSSLTAPHQSSPAQIPNMYSIQVCTQDGHQPSKGQIFFVRFKVFSSRLV